MGERGGLPWCSAEVSTWSTWKPKLPYRSWGREAPSAPCLIAGAGSEGALAISRQPSAMQAAVRSRGGSSAHPTRQHRSVHDEPPLTPCRFTQRERRPRPAGRHLVCVCGRCRSTADADCDATHHDCHDTRAAQFHDSCTLIRFDSAFFSLQLQPYRFPPGMRVLCLVS